jgi:hypothetical protein
MERSLPQENNIHLASQESHRLLWKLKVRYSPSPRPCVIFRDMLALTVKSCQPPRPTPMLQNYSLSTVRDCLFNALTTDLHVQRTQTLLVQSNRNEYAKNCH